MGAAMREQGEAVVTNGPVAACALARHGRDAVTGPIA
jgi:hypothetical protein